MANFKGVVSWIDEDGHTSKETYWITAADLAAAETALEAAVEQADVLSLAKVTGVDLINVVDISAWTLKAAAMANSDVEIGGRFIFRTAAGKAMKHTIPGFDKNTYVNVGGLIDITDAEVLAWFQTIMVTLAANVDSNWVDLTSLDTAYEVFRGKR